MKCRHCDGLGEVNPLNLTIEEFLKGLPKDRDTVKIPSILMNHKLRYVYHLVYIGAAGLLGIKNMGRRRVEILANALKDQGLHSVADWNLPLIAKRKRRFKRVLMKGELNEVAIK